MNLNDGIKLFKAGKFLFDIVPVNKLYLPEYKGSSFRGGLGESLKKTVCAQKKKDCNDCLLKNNCIYLKIFETPLPCDAQIMRKYRNTVHPFVLTPPLNNQTEFISSDILTFEIILFGETIKLIDYFINAIKLLGEIGIGKQKGEFILKEVRQITNNGVQQIYSENNENTIYKLNYDNNLLVNKSEIENHRTIQFITPARILFNKKIIMFDEKDFQFFILIRSLLRRFYLIMYFHFNIELEIDYCKMLKLAESVKIVSQNLKWYDWKRFSNRKKQFIPMGGFIGEVRFDENINEFMSLLKIGEYLHIGNYTAFGMGKYIIKGIVKSKKEEKK
ncbi:MAG: CRISPR system precrRNA processing endoribonuclease RAMP protein Cas6 [Candidatus Firestonebacteria bacterium]|nr:CRISPR system precrRNA processing endoribonuclease RAMP protein Cas6 [Candidatus Firestonebacteria bacterium]